MSPTFTDEELESRIKLAIVTNCISTGLAPDPDAAFGAIATANVKILALTKAIHSLIASRDAEIAALRAPVVHKYHFCRIAGCTTSIKLDVDYCDAHGGGKSIADAALAEMRKALSASTPPAPVTEGHVEAARKWIFSQTCEPLFGAGRVWSGTGPSSETFYSLAAILTSMSPGRRTIDSVPDAEINEAVLKLALKVDSHFPILNGPPKPDRRCFSDNDLAALARSVLASWRDAPQGERK